MPQDASATQSSRQNAPLPFLHLPKDGEDFERFCTDLLKEHPRFWVDDAGSATQRRVLTAERLAGGSNQQGADIRATIEGGQVWMIQCKRVEDFGPANAEQVIKRLESGFPNADRYVLAITKTLGLATKECFGPKWMIWDADQLTGLVRQLESKPRAMNLIRRYFGENEVRRLLPWTLGLRVDWLEYFRESLQEDCLLHHRLPFIPMGQALKDLLTFAREGGGRAQVLVGGGGQGKSRLLLEVARELDGNPAPDRIHVQLIGQHAPLPSEYDLEDLTQENQPTLLILDDAHHRLETLERLAGAASRSSHVRLLAVTQPSALALVRRSLRRGGYDRRVDDEIVIARWTRTRIQELAEAALGTKHSYHLPRLCELAQRSPLLVVLGAAAVRSNHIPDQMLTSEAFEDHVLGELISGLVEHQSEERQEGLRDLIKVLAFVGPVQDDRNLPRLLANAVGQPELLVAKDLDSLLTSGLTIEGNGGIRLYPDLLSHAVLRQAAIDESGRPRAWSRFLAQRLKLSDFPSILRNLSIADSEGTKGAGNNPANSLIEPVWIDLQRRFSEGSWKERQQLLEAWIPTASYQPERSLQLARLALSAPDAPQDADNPVISFETLDDLGPEPVEECRARILTKAGLVLEQIVVWHPEQASVALDLLWELADRLPTSGSHAHQHPVNVIARAAEFGLYKPLSAYESVLSWIEKNASGPGDPKNRLRVQGTLSALLKPFFGRSFEQSWQTGNVIHSQRILADPEKVGPLRKRALALIHRELRSGDEARVHAALPCLRIAVERYHDLGSLPDDSAEVIAWRGQRMEALEALSTALPFLAKHPFTLLEVLALLQFLELQADPQLSATARAIRTTVEDGFELRVARAISWNLHEYSTLSAPPLDWSERFNEGLRHQAEFITNAARECVQRWPNAEAVCSELGKLVGRAQAIGRSTRLHEFGQAVASLLPEQSGRLVTILTHSPTDYLDDMLPPFLMAARDNTPDQYDSAVAALARSGAPDRLTCWVRSLSLRTYDRQTLRKAELAALRDAAQRTDDGVVGSLATLAGQWLPRDPQLSADLFGRLKPASKNAAQQIIGALRTPLEVGGPGADPKCVEICLNILTQAGLRWLSQLDHDSQAILRTAPVVAYQNLASQVDAGHGPDLLPLANGPFWLGPIPDTVFLDQEIERHWAASDHDSVLRSARISLIRALIVADPTGAPGRRHALIQKAGTAEDLLRAVRVAFPDGSQAVLAWPELVALSLEHSERLGNVAEISGHLFRSICFGSRSATSGQMTTPYASIVDRAQDLAHRHEANHPLAELYRRIANAESGRQKQMRADYLATVEQDD